jgi:hypothetical protein
VPNQQSVFRATAWRDLGFGAPTLHRRQRHRAVNPVEYEGRPPRDSARNPAKGCLQGQATQGPCPSPTVTGSAQTGQTLTAAPNGSPTNPTYQWLRCDGVGASCSAITGASATTYTISTADQGHTLRFRKTATDSSGSQVSDSTQTAVVPPPTPVPNPTPVPIVPPMPPPPLVVAPVLSGLGLNPSVFAAAPRGPTAQVAAKNKANFGTVVSYRDSQAAGTSLGVFSRESASASVNAAPRRQGTPPRKAKPIRAAAGPPAITRW